MDTVPGLRTRLANTLHKSSRKLQALGEGSSLEQLGSFPRLHASSPARCTQNDVDIFRSHEVDALLCWQDVVYQQEQAAIKIQAALSVKMQSSAGPSVFVPGGPSRRPCSEGTTSLSDLRVRSSGATCR